MNLALPPKWEAYERLQTSLSKHPNLDDQYWALEAAADAILNSPTELTTAEVSTVMKTTRRRERHRSELRSKFMPPTEAMADPVPDMDIQLVFKAVKPLILDPDMALFEKIATGHTNVEIADLYDISPGNAGVRILRARKRAYVALMAFDTDLWVSLLAA